MIALLAALFEAFEFLMGLFTVSASSTAAIGIGALVVAALNFIKNYWFFAAATVGLTLLAHNIYDKLIHNLFQSIPEPFGPYVLQALNLTSYFSTMAWFVTFLDLWLAYKVVQKAGTVSLGKRT